MRRRLGSVAVLVLASLTCQPQPKEELFPERVRCPQEIPPKPGAAPLAGSCRLFDTDDVDGYPDLKVCPVAGKPRRDEVESDREGTFRVEYDPNSAISWEKPAPAAPTTPAPLELAPSELSRVVPILQLPVDSKCLADPHVSYYLGELRDRMRSRWRPPSAGMGADRNVIVMFSLSASGELTGACFEPPASDALGASVIRALQRASPYESMTTAPDDKIETQTKGGRNETTTETRKIPPNPTACLAGRRIIANFELR